MINTIRRASYRYPPRYKALYAARVELPSKPLKNGKPGKAKNIAYKCATCKELYKRKEVQVDHVIPVVGKEGFQNWHIYIIRMFPEDETGFQVLCSGCHSIKTQQEQNARKAYRDSLLMQGHVAENIQILEQKQEVKTVSKRKRKK